MTVSYQPRVSIGLPVYNGANYIGEALDSILAQTFADFELIISDNGSTDETQYICEDYARRDDRIHYLRHEDNRGATWNYNYVFERAEAPYFKWGAHDDSLAPDYLERCVEILDRDPLVVLCYPQTLIVEESGNPVGKYDDHLHLRSADPSERFRGVLFRPVGECNAVFGLMRRNTLGLTPLIRSYVGSDLVLLSELALRGQIHEVPERLFFRRDHPLSSLHASKDATDCAAWFDPALKLDVHLWNWHWTIDFLSSIFRVPMSLSERVRCLAAWCKWTRWQRVKLWDEIVSACKAAGARFIPRGPRPTRKL